MQDHGFQLVIGIGNEKARPKHLDGSVTHKGSHDIGDLVSGLDLILGWTLQRRCQAPPC